MAGEEQKKRKHTALHNSAVILLGTLLTVIIVLCIFIACEIRSMQSQIIVLQQEVTSLGEQVAAEEKKQQAELVVENEKIQGAAEADSEEQASLDVDFLENQLELDYIEQDGGTWDENTGIRRVYLTFDDGPSTYTNEILDILNEYGVKATFFVVGKEGYTEEYQRIVEEGHTLGMHSFSHKYQEMYQSLDSYKEDLTKLHEFLYETTGVDSRIVRFPGGSSNKTSKVDMQELISYLTEENIVYYDWNVSSGDASNVYVSAQQIANNVLNNVWKYDSVIVLMHDSSAKYATVQALPTIIEKILESENTVLLPISEDTVPIQHIKAECQ